MPTYHKILVAIDVSEESAQVLAAARDIAGGDTASISVIHVMENYLTSYNLYGYTPAFNDTEIREQIFKQLSEQVSKAGLSPDCLTVAMGDAATLITDKAKEDKADLIVVGSHGRHGIKLLLGSTANGVLHHAHCNVLAVRIREEQ